MPEANLHFGENEQFANPERWVDDHGDYLFRYALARLHDRGVAEDVVQQTFLAAMEGREKFEGRASERTWLVGILKHKVVDYLRKSSREVPVSSLLSHQDPSENLFNDRGNWRIEPTPWPDDPSTSLEQRAFWEALAACLSGLPRRLAQIFSLREFEGLGSEEICNLTGISATNLGVIFYRARMRLRQCLETTWFGDMKTGR